LVALGVVALLVALPTPAAAGPISFGKPAIVVGWGGSSSWGVYPRYYVRDWRARYYYPDYAPLYYYPDPVYYPQDQAVSADAATIRMHVPSDARVWFDDDLTSQTGPERTFVSPPLPRGRQFVYHIRVEWDENGKAVERKRDVPVHAGDRISLNIDR
jgi:uncharacterized protein (TIGR03000 family)